MSWRRPPRRPGSRACRRRGRKRGKRGERTRARGARARAWWAVSLTFRGAWAPVLATASCDLKSAARLAAPGELLEHPAVRAVVPVLLGRIAVESTVVRLGRPAPVQEHPLVVRKAREQPLADRRPDGSCFVLRQLPDAL